jgi:hypothetical protein
MAGIRPPIIRHSNLRTAPVNGVPGGFKAPAHMSAERLSRAASHDRQYTCAKCRDAGKRHSSFLKRSTGSSDSRGEIQRDQFTFLFALEDPVNEENTQ